MDNGAHVQSQVPKEIGQDNAKQIVQLQADLLDANALIDSLKELDDFFAWQQFKRILIDPTIAFEKRKIEVLNRDLKNHPETINELIGHNAFVEVLEMITDFSKLSKKYGQSVKLLSGRLKQLQKQ